MIVLGPLLGYENDGNYTFCILLDRKVKDIYCHIISGDQTSIVSESYERQVKEYLFYRFEYDCRAYQGQDIKYFFKIKDSEDQLTTRHSINEWHFRIPNFDSQPEIAQISCSGMDTKYPTDINETHFLGWKQLLFHKPHYMILSGDQVYADTIFKKIKSTKLFVEKGICLFEDDEIDNFYLNLYIDSWANRHMAQALAEIPNIMTWDDHDIIDGYGSYSHPYYNRLDIFFKYASKYFELFQIRTTENKSLISNNPNEERRKDFTQVVILGNNLYVIPDTRSQRTWKKVLDESQYRTIDNKLEKLWQSHKTFHLCAFVLPVPIAHRDFKNNFEKYSSKYFDKLLGFGMLTDDLIDHWDHDYHKPEQKVMMDFIFHWGEKFDIKYLVIVSGDVHCSGAASITRTSEFNKQKFATQLVSSPMVNKPSGIIAKINDYISDNYKSFDNYSCHLLSFGNYRVKDVYARNFMIIKQNSGGKVCSILHMETDRGWTNKHEGIEIERQLRSYRQLKS